MSRKLLYVAFLCILLFPFSSVLAQNNGTLTGKVTDSKSGEALPGANVYIQELNKGASTDGEGTYIIHNVQPGTYTLRASFIGYKETTKTVELDAGSNTVDFALESSIQNLDELVVTGYGVQSRREVTGSITKVSRQSIEGVPIETADQALQGHAAGVSVISESGAPGGGLRVRVRGTGSINAGNDPLYIIDGVQVNNTDGLSSVASSNALTSLNPSDIESIEVLKDAAAASIYGAQAANGVVIITTKRGKAGNTQFTANYKTGTVQETKQYDVLSGPQWADYFTTALGNTYAYGASEDQRRYTGYNILAGVFGADNLEAAGSLEEVNTAIANANTYDWQDAVYRVGRSHNFNLSASGGNDQTQFYASGGYDYKEGQVYNSDFDRFSFRTNIDHRANEKLNFKVNLGLTSVRQNGTIEDGNFINGPIFQAPFEPPVIPIYNDDGTYNRDVRFSYNIVEFTKDVVRKSVTNQAISNLSASYNFLPQLTLTSMVGVNYRDVRDTQYRNPILDSEGIGSDFEANRRVLNWNTSHVLNYKTTLNEDHSISGLAGVEYRQEKQETFTAFGKGFPNELFRTLNSAAEPRDVTGFTTEFRMASAFGKVDYAYKERYLASATLRYDGSSRFGADKKYGLFYSGSLAWRLSQENFLQNAGFIDEMKLRLSYGVTGNSDIDNFASRSLFGAQGTYDGSTALRATQLGNNLLTWEEAQTLNLGLDWALWEGRVSGSFDVYRRLNKDLLLNAPLPLDSGFGGIYRNVGEVENRGVEFEIRTVNFNRGGFLWSTDFNISYRKNELKSLVGDQDQIIDGITILKVGEPISSYYLPDFAGVNPADGRPMWYDENGQITYNPQAADNRVQDGWEPDYVGGFNSTFKYKNVSLDVFFQYAIGATTFMQQEYYFLDTPQFLSGVRSGVLHHWNQPGDMTDTPKPYYGGSEPGTGTANYRITPSNRSLEDASYMRLKSVRVAYTLPISFMRDIGMRGATVYVEGLNLYTWTAFTGVDPEIVQDQNASYPMSKQFVGGIQLQF